MSALMLRYGDETIPYEVVYRASRRTLAIEVHPDCRVLVRAPTSCAQRVIADRVTKRARWISKQIADFRRYRPRTPPRRYLAGESHLYLGRQLRLKIVVGPAAITASRGLITVCAPQPSGDRVRSILQRWYRERAHEVFAETLQRCMSRFKGVRPPRLVIRTMKSRWGSLSRLGTMTLNVALVRAPRTCIEYVITHELCHLRHRKHDAQFFALLRSIMPDWQARKSRLEGALL